MPQSEFEIIYNGVDFDEVLKPNPRAIQKEIRDLSIPVDSPVIGTVFRFVRRRDPSSG